MQISRVLYNSLYSLYYLVHHRPLINVVESGVGIRRDNILICILPAFVSFPRQCFFSRSVKVRTAVFFRLTLSHVCAQQTTMQQRGFGAQCTWFCQMSTALINHLLAKLTLGNYLWILILFAVPILLPWILALAESCPSGPGT